MGMSAAGVRTAVAWAAISGAFTRLRRDRSGATAIEFGILALPFLALMMAIIETALMFFAGQTMDTAVTQVARQIRTGQAQQKGYDLAKFKSDICTQIAIMFSCTGGLKIKVEKFATFDSIKLNVPVDGSGNLSVTEKYEPGHGGDIVVVSAYYEWPVFINKLGNNLANEPNGKHLLVSTVAFRNEPFPW